MGRLPKKTEAAVLQTHLRLPSWIRRERTSLRQLHEVKVGLRESRLNTVCEEARCPNRTHCFAHGTATFLLMGDVCTRACGFCSIQSGKPLALNPKEPDEIARRIQSMGLKYAVLTSVNRDDLLDGGADHIARTVIAIRQVNPHVLVEVLAPDFCGNLDAVARVVGSGLAVFNHNTETVPSRYAEVRPAGRFTRSLDVLKTAKTLGVSLYGEAFKTKSGLMLGLGETLDELQEVFMALRQVGVDILTLGQYLRPTRFQLPVQRYIPPEEFDTLGRLAKSMGFPTVYSGPMVRSSFNAFEVGQQEGIIIL